MRKLAIVLIVFVLAACNSAPPSGNYLLVPVTGTFVADYSYCEGSNCWGVKLATLGSNSTQEITPTLDATPTQELTCRITPTDGNVNVRNQPVTGKVIGVMQSGAETQALALSNGWYKIWWYLTAEYGWTKAEFYMTSGDCSSLPLS